jgi:hypothetical protein
LPGYSRSEAALRRALTKLWAMAVAKAVETGTLQPYSFK